MLSLSVPVKVLPYGSLCVMLKFLEKNGFSIKQDQFRCSEFGDHLGLQSVGLTLCLQTA